MLRGKSHVPRFGEPWTLQEPGTGQPCYIISDRAGREVLRTPGETPADARIADRVMHAVNGTVNFTPGQLERLADKWNENARRQRGGTDDLEG